MEVGVDYQDEPGILRTVPGGEGANQWQPLR